MSSPPFWVASPSGSREATRVPRRPRRRGRRARDGARGRLRGRARDDRGCSGGLSGCTAIAGDGGVRERELPARPTDLDPETVESYVADYEAVRAHNAHAADGATAVTIDAVATFDHRTGDAYHATAQYAGSVSYQDDSGRTVDELDADPTPYRVTPDRTLRFDARRRTVEAETAADGERVAPPLGVRLLNASGESRELDATVSRPAEGETLVSLPVTVPSASAVELRAITDVPDSYRVTVRVEADGVTGEGRIDVGLPGVDRAPNVDVIVADAGISTRRLPPFDGV
ncbi:hypothetical protein [Halorubrum sp. CBA1125]|uniref:hypothetical protein n=1 Tax=Halorubrum sp. CBA1125 TaxID=2668072 RepID=UPI0018D259B6|nr:hypothetical protein [Halorubrum sp. CBA1125]